MSVEKTDYVGYGIVFKKSTYDGFDDLYEQIVDGELEEKYPIMKIHGTKNISIILDGMNGSYIFIGYVLASADEYEGFDFVRLPRELDFKTKLGLTNMFLDEFGFSHILGICDIMVFSQWG